MKPESRRLELRPGLWPTLVAVPLFVALVGLGFWQLDRAEQKRDLFARLEAARAQPAVDLAAVEHPADLPMFRAVAATGRFDGAHQFLVDNQIRDGRAGYRVLTPLKIRGSRAVLVDRGWRPGGPDRSVLPELDTPEGVSTVEGITGDGPSVGIRLGPPHAGEGNWPRRIAYVDFDYMRTAVPYELLPFIIEPAGGGNSVAEAVESFGPERHVGYAVQWFALAAALAVIYVGVNLRRSRE